MRQTLPLPLASARVVVPGFSPSVCVLYPSAKAVKSRKVVYELYNTAGGGGDDDGEFRFDAHPQTENVCVHSTAHCTLTSSSTSCFTTTASFIIILAGVFLPCVRDGGNAQLFFSPSPPALFFLFLFYCSVYYFVIFDLYVCVCVTTLRFKITPKHPQSNNFFSRRYIYRFEKKKMRVDI